MVTCTGVSCGASFSHARVIESLSFWKSCCLILRQEVLLDWLPNQGIEREPYRRWQPTAPGSSPRSVGLPGRTGMTPVRRPSCWPETAHLCSPGQRRQVEAFCYQVRQRRPMLPLHPRKGEGITCLWGWVRNGCTIRQSEALTRQRRSSWHQALHTLASIPG